MIHLLRATYFCDEMGIAFEACKCIQELVVQLSCRHSANQPLPCQSIIDLFSNTFQLVGAAAGGTHTAALAEQERRKEHKATGFSRDFDVLSLASTITQEEDVNMPATQQKEADSKLPNACLEEVPISE